MIRSATIVVLLCAMAAPISARAQASLPKTASPTAATYVPDLAPLLRRDASELRDIVDRFSTDREALLRRYDVDYSAERRGVMADFYATWLARLGALRYDPLSLDGRVDFLLLRSRVEYERALVAREARRMNELAPLLPFAPVVIGFAEARRRLEPVDPEAAARVLARVAVQIDSTRQAVDTGAKPTKIAAFRAAAIVGGLRRTLERWFKFSDGYDPMFSWWARAPYRVVDSSLQTYGQMLREKIVGAKPGEDEPIVGLPIGRDAILEDLAHEMIPYTPEELIVVAQRELAWGEAEMRKAARAMGLGDDWKAALERVKEAHVDPGHQPELVRDLAREALAFVEQRDLVTVPPLARDMWRMEMLSPAAQKASPFFLGGEVIQVSFPTETMSEDDKLMSMRGNNRHFARATVFHELIPGHHLQGFMTDRYQPQRRTFETPFWIEGNAFYWEMLLWDLGFPQSPEDRIGMLFWRMHRAARIIFSMNFHLGNWTPQQCIDFLIDRVGHERANATAEVRRSFNGDYSPLYQVAYMIGGLQFRALHAELVDTKRMTNRQFHDAILQNGAIPVELVRVELTRAGPSPARDWRPGWRFAEGRQ